MNAHEIHALSGAYAVDALNDGERAFFEEHLSACEACREEVASLQAGTALLAELSATTPPPELRASILAEIKNVRPLPPVGGVTELAARRRRPRWSGLVAAAAAAAVFVGGGSVLLQQTHGSHSTDQLGAAERVILARDVQRVNVDLPHGASATVYRSVSLGEVALRTRRMPAAPNGRVYQLWLEKGGRMIPAGLMRAGGNQTVLLEGSLKGASGAGITVEPAGGSPAPTTVPIALFDFEQAT